MARQVGRVTPTPAALTEMAWAREPNQAPLVRGTNVASAVDVTVAVDLAQTPGPNRYTVGDRADTRCRHHAK